MRRRVVLVAVCAGVVSVALTVLGDGHLGVLGGPVWWALQDIVGLGFLFAVGWVAGCGYAVGRGGGR